MTKVEWAINLLDSEHFKELFKELREVEVSKIVNSDSNDIQARETAYLMINAYNKIYSSIEAMATEKKMVEKRFKIW
jgi:hypothetical protein